MLISHGPMVTFRVFQKISTRRFIGSLLTYDRTSCLVQLSGVCCSSFRQLAPKLAYDVLSNDWQLGSKQIRAMEPFLWFDKGHVIFDKQGAIRLRESGGLHIRC